MPPRLHTPVMGPNLLGQFVAAAERLLAAADKHLDPAAPTRITALARTLVRHTSTDMHDPMEGLCAIVSAAHAIVAASEDAGIQALTGSAPIDLGPGPGPAGGN